MRTYVKKYDFFVTMLLVLMLSVYLQAATEIIGDFEADSMDDWTVDAGTTTDFSTDGVTHGVSSLEVTFPTGWVMVLGKIMISQVDVLQTMTSINLDVTTRNDGNQIPGWWLGFSFIINSETGGWQQYDLDYAGVPWSPRTDTLTLEIPQAVRDNFTENGVGSYAEFFIVINSGGGVLWIDNINVETLDPPVPTISIDADSAIRTIPMSLYGASLQAWDGVQAGTNTTFNNLMKASGRKYMRVPGGSWGNGHLWSDIEGPYGANAWKVSYTETLTLLNALSQPGETVHPMMQPIVNFPGWWYETLQDDTPGDDDNQNYAVAHVNAVNAAAAWVQDQTARAVCAEYWEIGNEIGGPWEAGYFPEISGTFYGDYFADFYLAMKAVNPGIKIGACAEPVHELQPWGWYEGYWTHDTLAAAFVKDVVPDFLIIHQYPGSGEDASYNPTLLSTDINKIGIYTSNLDAIVEDAIGADYVDQVRYTMTEWDTGNHDDYSRKVCYVNALFHAQYILEMAKYDWDVSNPWIPEYGVNFAVYPVWYVNPLLIHYFGQDMVETTITDSSELVRAYAAKDTGGNLTIFIANNSPTEEITEDIIISNFSAGANGLQWLIEPAGSIISGGVNIQDKDDISINGVVHPNPLTASSFASQALACGNSFSVTVPASCMLLLKIPDSTADSIPPAAPAGLTATAGTGLVVLDWDDSAEEDLASYTVYRALTAGGNAAALATGLVSSTYTDNNVIAGRTYYYVVTAVDTSTNESAQSAQVWARPNRVCNPTTIRPYIRVDSGRWVRTGTVTVNAGQTVSFRPMPGWGGSWSWSGPDDYSAATREIVLSDIQLDQAGTYTATYTNACGAESQQEHTITVNVPPPAFVAAGAIAAGTETITPALPLGIAEDDILLLFVETANQVVSISDAGGGVWTEVTDSPQGTGEAGSAIATRLTAFWSRYDGIQGAPTVSDSGDHQLGRIIAIRGAAAAGDPWDVTAGNIEAITDTSASIPGATTTDDNTLVVAAIAGSLPDSTRSTNFSFWRNSSLTGLTERTDNSIDSGNGGALSIAMGVKAAAGAYGNTTVSTRAAVKGMMSIAIKN